MANGEDPVSGDGGGWQQVLDALKNAAENLVTLNITTTVVGAESKEIKTTIDLLQGDISNSIDEAFLRDADLQSIRDFHAEQVAKGHTIIKGNVDVVVDLAKQFGAILE